MIILGRYYKFNNFEKDILNKKFKNITTIDFNNENSKKTITNINDNLSNKKFNLILLNIEEKLPNEIIKFLTNLQFKKNIKFITIEYFFEKYFKKCYIPNYNKNLSYLENIKPFTPFQYFQKRLIDYIGAITLIIFTFPILIYSRKRIKQESPGTSIFRQVRVGKNGKTFKCVKFRSMELNAESNGAQFATNDDPRVFKWGGFMRKSRIDELPQILNVITGDMHLIGPRPERKIWTDKFEQEIPYYQERHLVKPGITGWAQINYPYGSNTEDARQKLMYDLYYIKNWSLWLEILIIFKTILVIINKKGL